MKKNTYYIITIGCQMNKSDSERIAGYLEERGYKRASERDKANVVVATTCGVRQSAEDRIYGLLPRIKKANPKCKIVLTGCLAGREDVRNRLKGSVDIWLPINELEELKTKLDRVVTGHCPVTTESAENNDGSIGGYLKIRPKYESPISAFVPIGNGCNNFCAYCVVPYARGREVYRPAKEILVEIKSLVKKGYKEVVLIAQNVNSYKSHNTQHITHNSSHPLAQTTPPFGHPSFQRRGRALPLAPPQTRGKQGEINFAKLLGMVNAIPGDFWIRFATSHPKDMSDELIKTIANCGKVCHHIHLPAQAGDNKVLARMNRKYTREHYLGLLKKIRQIMPDAVISTDVIVGFPDETREQFKNTEKLFREAKFDMAYTAQYSSRPGTAAVRFADNVPRAEKKRREEELMKILRKTALINNKKYEGKTVEVLIDGRGQSFLFGRTRTDKNVKITIAGKADNLLGKFVKVKITKARDFGLIGELA